MKTTVTEMVRINSWLDIAEETINEVENRALETAKWNAQIKKTKNEKNIN